MGQQAKNRQSGITTRQMLEAPENAIYVWPNSKLDYPNDLAKYLGRFDLTIISYTSIDHLREIKRPIIFDHFILYSSRR